MLLEVAERIRVVEAWRDAVGDRASLFVHVGASSTRDARTLAAHAESIGVEAISSISPPVYTAADLGQLVASLAEIASAAPRMPFFFYHNTASVPKVSGYDFLNAAQSQIPTLAGLKFTHEDLFDLSRVLRFADGRFNIFYGKDEFLLGAHAIGATKFIGGSFNVICPLVRAVLGAFDAGDIEAARAAQHKLVDVVAVLRKFGGLAAVKAAMALLGVECGGVRLPLKSVTPANRELLFAELKAVWPEIGEPAISRAATRSGRAVNGAAHANASTGVDVATLHVPVIT